MKLMNLAAPLAAAANGLWRGPWPEYGELEVKARPFTEAYQADLARSQAELVRQARQDGRLKGREGWDDLPLDVRLAHSRSMLLDRLVADVRGVEEDEGKPLTVDRFRELAKDVETWGPLSEAAHIAVSEVTGDRAALRKAAGGNFVPGSASSSGPAKPTS